MKTTIATKKIDLAERTTTLIEENLDKKLSKLVNEANIGIEKSGRVYKVSINSTGEFNGHNVSFYVSDEETNLFNAINVAIDLTKRKVKRAKTRYISKPRSSASTIQSDIPNVQYDNIEIKEGKTINLISMDEDEAAFYADMHDYDTFIYLDSKNDDKLSMLKKSNNAYEKFILLK